MGRLSVKTITLFLKETINNNIIIKETANNNIIMKETANNNNNNGDSK